MVEFEQEHKAADNQNTAVEHHEQSDSVTATKFCLASLLTSSNRDSTYVTAPVSLVSSISAPTSTQSVHDQHDPLDSQPPHDKLLSNHARSCSSDFNGQRITSVSMEKSLNSYCKINRQLFVKAETRTTPNLSEDSSIGTNSICSSSDDINSKKLDCEDSTSSSKTKNAHSSLHVDATPICEDDSSSSASKTTTIGLVDLLTTAFEDKDSTPIVDSSEDKWISPQSLKEVNGFYFFSEFVKHLVCYGCICRYLF